MLIRVSSLYRDTSNFLRHQWVNIILMAFLISCITILLNKSLMPSLDQIQVINNKELISSTNNLIEIIRNMSPQQQHVLFQVSAVGTFSSLVGNTMLLGGMLSLISIASSGKKVSALIALGASIPSLARLFLLISIMTLSIQLGFMVLVFPGILLSVLFALAPIIITTDKVGLFTSIQTSSQIGWSQIRFIAPSVMFWMLSKILILLLASKLIALPPDIISIILNTFSNLISAILIVYLFRLYMLLN
ncbi:YciC family protein [Candidatus Erwinia haradaeae]|uniref:UPF0259 membrane protein ERCIPICE3303_473 n=1 Tax=Candidatus Erwinia haradaeae TaxID=1922217 RepID=A0A803FU24_9GAMM|nr:YciC family protein [Candidatus Erwinia haradaeae]VFP88454.1 UPF0259 membrane protein YciC [Candidatus Erwinia haradaeae]